MFGSNKVKTLERENIALHREVATHEETIEAQQAKIQTMQAEHSRELTAIQIRYTAETVNLTKQHEKEISLLKAIISKVVKWFPYFREMIRMESVCRTVGFDDKQTITLIKGKPLEYSGELYSEEHNCKFTVERVTAQNAYLEVGNVGNSRLFREKGVMVLTRIAWAVITISLNKGFPTTSDLKHGIACSSTLEQAMIRYKPDTQYNYQDLADSMSIIHFM